MDFSLEVHQHLRYNPLIDQWVLVSPHRLSRPWNGQIEDTQEDAIPEFDPSNPLCPGVVRPNGIKNENYSSTFVFDNDFAALNPERHELPTSTDPIFQVAEATGKCRVMCFHPKTNITIPLMTTNELKNVIDRWIEQFDELSKDYLWVQIFENKGAIMGCSNPHPHCQIWASSFFPNEPRIKDLNQKLFYQKYKKPLLIDYVNKELAIKKRIVVENNDWVTVVPFWAVWPYEVLLLPKTHVRRISELNDEQRISLSDIMKKMTTKYDNLFKTSFPYSMGWHGAPTGNKYNENMDHWVFHGIYLPPLLRSATIKKFMVGFELLANVQRDLTPEKAADHLRSQSEIHYTVKEKNNVDG